MEDKVNSLKFDKLVEELKSLNSEIGSYAYYIFGIKHVNDFDTINVSQLVKAAGLTESMQKEIGKAKRVADLIKSGKYGISLIEQPKESKEFSKEELVKILVDLYTDNDIKSTSAGGIFTFAYGRYVVDVYTPTELMEAANKLNPNVKTRYAAELNGAFLMYRYFRNHPEMLERTQVDMMSLVLNDYTGYKKQQKHFLSGQPLQKIVYGAPGTGKSFGTDDKIKEIHPSKEEQKENVFRTTFHPDSDYSTFVGAYKPTKVKAKQSQVILDYDSLVDRYKEYIEVKKNMTIASTLMGYDYHDSIVKMQPQHTIGELVADAYKNNTTYDSVLRGGMAVYESNPSVKSDKITYSFVPQTFTKAYIQAWKNYISGDKKPVFLVIEEINRGNCAQIFGDLFQLLDRDDETGMSSYPIKPDTDLGNFIADELSGLAGKMPECQSIIEGEELLLPSNLHIWATMNTSDQSLFPIDSAFKRRWKWEYVKIKNGVDKKTQQPLDWTIKFDHDNGECNHKWWDFIQQINKIIASMTSSADKQLGYFFCKPDKQENDAEKNTIISEEAFVGKVVFYLWNDVFKNYAMDEGNLFKFKAKPDTKDEDLTFPDFYDEEGNVNGYVAAQFIDHVMAWEKDKED